MREGERGRGSRLKVLWVFVSGVKVIHRNAAAAAAAGLH